MISKQELRAFMSGTRDEGFLEWLLRRGGHEVRAGLERQPGSSTLTGLVLSALTSVTPQVM